MEADIVHEYLVYAWFRRLDRPGQTGAFLSKRWCSIEDVLASDGAVQEKIDAWEFDRSARLLLLSAC